MNRYGFSPLFYQKYFFRKLEERKKTYSQLLSYFNETFKNDATDQVQFIFKFKLRSDCSSATVNLTLNLMKALPCYESISLFERAHVLSEQLLLVA